MIPMLYCCYFATKLIHLLGDIALHYFFLLVNPSKVHINCLSITSNISIRQKQCQFDSFNLAEATGCFPIMHGSWKSSTHLSIFAVKLSH